jgi:hypothetical protein
VIFRLAGSGDQTAPRWTISRSAVAPNHFRLGLYQLVCDSRGDPC